VLLVLVMLVHERRRIVHCHVTEHPTPAWTAQQIVGAFPWNKAPRYLLRDRDRIYGDVFGQRVRNMGTPVARPVQLPKFGRVREIPEVGGFAPSLRVACPITTKGWRREQASSKFCVFSCYGISGPRLVIRVLDMIISVTYDGTRIGGRL
jgi:hypothetical protein